MRFNEENFMCIYFDLLLIQVDPPWCQSLMMRIFMEKEIQVTGKSYTNGTWTKRKVARSKGLAFYRWSVKVGISAKAMQVMGKLRERYWRLASSKQFSDAGKKKLHAKCRRYEYWPRIERGKENHLIFVNGITFSVSPLFSISFLWFHFTAGRSWKKIDHRGEIRWKVWGKKGPSLVPGEVTKIWCVSYPHMYLAKKTASNPADSV